MDTIYGKKSYRCIILIFPQCERHEWNSIHVTILGQSSQTALYENWLSRNYEPEEPNQELKVPYEQTGAFLYCFCTHKKPNNSYHIFLTTEQRKCISSVILLVILISALECNRNESVRKYRFYFSLHHWFCSLVAPPLRFSLTRPLTELLLTLNIRQEASTLLPNSDTNCTVCFPILGNKF